MNSESRQIASNRTIPHPIAPYRVIALSAHHIFVMSGRWRRKIYNLTAVRYSILHVKDRVLLAVGNQWLTVNGQW